MPSTTNHSLCPCIAVPLGNVQLEFTSLMVLYSRFKIKTFYDVGPLYGYTSSLFTAYLSRFDESMILTSVRGQITGSVPTPRPSLVHSGH